MSATPKSGVYVRVGETNNYLGAVHLGYYGLQIKTNAGAVWVTGPTTQHFYASYDEFWKDWELTGLSLADEIPAPMTEPTKNVPESAVYRFTGTDGSMGFRHGHRYYLTLAEVRQNGQTNIWITFPHHCPYESIESFYANWEKVNLPFPIRSNAS